MIEPNTFICADNMEVLREIPDGFCDLCLTDPPYGLNMAKWDVRVPMSVFAEMFRISQNQIVWGGNYYHLPITESWLCWNKIHGFSKPPLLSMSDFELAWMSFSTKPRLIPISCSGNIINGKVDYTYASCHPTQKPVPLFVWCLLNCSKPGDLIIDPFCGSGTTALACHKTGRRFICIDREQKYIDIAQQRYKDLTAQQELFGADTMESGAQAYNSGRDAMPQQMELGL